jgi:hypothetical protein
VHGGGTVVFSGPNDRVSLAEEVASFNIKMENMIPIWSFAANYRVRKGKGKVEKRQRTIQ